MAGLSPSCTLDFLAAGARSTEIAAGAQISAPQGNGKIGHSSTAQQISDDRLGLLYRQGSNETHFARKHGFSGWRFDPSQGCKTNTG